jgi:hypothetical protein
MLPLIVIGATDRVREILEPYAQVGHIQYHRTAEDAHRALTDETVAEMAADELAEPMLEADSRWSVHVAYGPASWGALCRANVGFQVQNEARLPHSGHTLVFGLDVHEPALSIRAVGGEPEIEPEHTMIWSAGVMVRADLILDLENPEAIRHLIGYLDWKDGA